MSRILGRANDVLNISNTLKNTDLLSYNKDNRKSSWEKIDNIKEELIDYLPSIAIDFINKDKISILKNPLRIYTFTSVPEYKDENRIIRFPSLTPKKEFEREYAFYLGLLLSSYQNDTEEELLELGREYDDIIPLLIEYVYLKENNLEDRYSIKYLNELKKYTRYYSKNYKKYKKFYDFYNNAETHDLDDREYENFKELSDYYDEEMERVTLPNIIKLSSFDATLQIIDKNYNHLEYKQLIRELMLNKDESRSSILYERGIESYGYKRLNKEINNKKR